MFWVPQFAFLIFEHREVVARSKAVDRTPTKLPLRVNSKK
jgi:hypothetical protein